MKIIVAFDTGDEDIAKAFVQILRSWFGDSVEITFSPEFAYGSDWRDLLRDALRGNDVLLALCTPRSVGNRWLHFEVGAFFGQAWPVIPVTLRGLRPDDLPEPLNTFQEPNLEVEDDMAKLANEIVNGIEIRLLDGVRLLDPKRVCHVQLILIDLGEEFVQFVGQLLRLFDGIPVFPVGFVTSHRMAPGILDEGRGRPCACRDRR